MFSKDFYPTPESVAYQMLNGYDVHGKTVLEPSAGKGDLINVLQKEGATVIACELNDDLRKIVEGKCTVMGADFLKLKAEQISHIDFIIMNPPFSKDEKHILHAWEIAPAGCKIISLCNSDTLGKRYYSDRKKLAQIVEEFGSSEHLGNCFEQSERRTGVSVSVVRMQKPGADYSTEFNGFFMEDDQPEEQANAIMSYNVVRDLVNRYVAALKLFDQQIELGIQMQQLTALFCKYEYDSSTEKLGFQVKQEDKVLTRSQFKKDMQKQGWAFIFSKMDMKKYTTRGLKEDINKFVEQQTQLPFSMRNIYQMLKTVVGTTGQRMDKAIIEVFDILTEHHNENRYHVEGWKTNSHYMVNKRFIFPYGAETKWGGGVQIRHGSAGETLRDCDKALCFITGQNYDDILGISSLDKMEPGQWHYTHFFKIKAYKKGTVHCEFLDEDVWAKFNIKVAELKGYPLPEFKHTKETERRNEATAKNYRPPVRNTKPGGVLFEIDVTPANREGKAA